MPVDDLFTTLYTQYNDKYVLLERARAEVVIRQSHICLSCSTCRQPGQRYPIRLVQFLQAEVPICLESKLARLSLSTTNIAPLRSLQQYGTVNLPLKLYSICYT